MGFLFWIFFILDFEIIYFIHSFTKYYSSYFSKLDIEKPCPFFFSKPISFSEICKNTVHCIMLLFTIFGDSFVTELFL